MEKGGGGVCVEIISKELIKPSSKTPPHLKNLKLSYLDQIARPVYFPIIFFYEADEVKGLTTSNHLQISQHLKHSLSDALVPFYPLAGTLGHTNSVVDCNDAGVEFVDACIHAHLMDVIKDPNMEELKQFLPLDPTTAGNPRERAFVLVQVTLFDCGGIAVGICFSHQVADCVSVMALVEEWAAVAACRRQLERSSFTFSFDLEKYFPARDSLVSWLSGMSRLEEKFVTKRFVFDKRKLQILRETAASSVSKPTRVELVSAFIWRSFMEAGRAVGGEKKKQAAFHVVNLRPRSYNLENVFGNCIMFAFAFADGGGVEEECRDLIARLRASIGKIDGDRIGEWRSGDGYINDHREFFSEFARGEMEYCSFSSWSRFPVYEVDFGWGNPAWCCTTALPTKNLAVLLSSRGGEGIDAWVNMNERNLEMIQTQMSQSFPI